MEGRGALWGGRWKLLFNQQTPPVKSEKPPTDVLGVTYSGHERHSDWAICLGARRRNRRAVVSRRGHDTMPALPASLFAGTLRSLKYFMVREAPPQAPYSLDPKRESPAQFRLGK
ncbi:unnamed protein product [Gadus morhua 'NCC']